MPTEQQDRFSEQLGTVCGELVWTTRSVHELNQASRGVASLLGCRPTQIGRRGRHRASPPRELRRHCGPTVEQRALRRVARRSTRSVPIQPLQIEHTRTESEHPDLDGA
jgi:hypothetical protein